MGFALPVRLKWGPEGGSMFDGYQAFNGYVSIECKKWLISNDYGRFSSLSILVDMFSKYVHIYVGSL